MRCRLVAALAAAAAAARLLLPLQPTPQPRCYGPFNHTYKLETPCSKVLASAGDLTVRQFVGGGAVTLVEKTVPSSV